MTKRMKFTVHFSGDKQDGNPGSPDHADVMTFLTRFVDAASKLTSGHDGHDGHDVLDLESRDLDASGPALLEEQEKGSDEDENQVHAV